MPSIPPLHTIERSLAAKLRLHTWPPLDVKKYESWHVAFLSE